MVYLVRHKTDTGPVPADILIHNIYNVHDENIYYYAYYGPVNIHYIIDNMYVVMSTSVHTVHILGNGIYR